MDKIIIDKQKCIGCGLCAKDCILKCIEKDKNNIAVFSKPDLCISCGHCFAICPKGAISFMGKSASEADEAQFDIKDEEILNLIKSRRSIRLYKKESVSDENLEKLKKMLSYIPTGVNNHNLHFSIVENKETMEKINKICTNKILKILNNPFLKPLASKFEFYRQAFEEGEDIIFRNAPNMIVVSSPKNAPCKREDAIIALSYFEMYANSLKIGTCWCGYAQMCIRLFANLSQILKIPKTHIPRYVMLFGYPDVKYSRTTLPNDFKFEHISKVENDKIGFFETLERFFINNFR